MTPVADHEAYASRLNHTMDEKLFFLDHITGDMLLVDFGSAGCALGTTARMREAVKGRAIIHLPFDEDPRFGVLAEWEEVLKRTQMCRPMIGKCSTVLLFSSVLHEVFSTFHEFSERQWVLNHAGDIDADYIVIRDMALPPGTPAAQAEEIEAFQKAQWLNGPDARRELEERYFSVPHDLGRQIEAYSMGAWKLVFENHYVPPAVRHRWWEEGHDLSKLPPFTHMQLILKRVR